MKNGGQGQKMGKHLHTLFKNMDCYLNMYDIYETLQNLKALGLCYIMLMKSLIM